MIEKLLWLKKVFYWKFVRHNKVSKITWDTRYAGWKRFRLLFLRWDKERSDWKKEHYGQPIQEQKTN